MPFSCEKCGKVFKARRDINTHKNRKYPCDDNNECSKCGKSFRNRFELIRHSNRKTSCEPIIAKNFNSIPLDKPVCEYCNRVLSSKRNLRRHYKTCNIKNGGMELLFKKLQEYEIMIKKLQKAISDQQSRPQSAAVGSGNDDVSTGSQITNNDNSITNNITVTNNVIVNNTLIMVTDNAGTKVPLRALGDENLSHITQEDVRESLSLGNECITDLAYKIHNTPENKNVYVSGERSDMAIAYKIKQNTGRWETRPLNVITKVITERALDIILDHEYYIIGDSDRRTSKQSQYLELVRELTNAANENKLHLKYIKKIRLMLKSFKPYCLQVR